MTGIRGARHFGLTPAQFQPTLLHKTQKMVSAQWVLSAELFRIHYMEFLTAYARVYRADALHIVCRHLFTQQKGLEVMPVILIVGLFCNTKQ